MVLVYLLLLLHKNNLKVQDMTFFTNLYNTIFLFFWTRRTSHPCTGKKLKIKRRYTQYSKKVYDLEWYIQDCRKQQKHFPAHVLSERSNSKNLRTIINRFENVTLYEEIKKIKEMHHIS